MPILNPTAYRPPPGLANGHLQTIIPALFRRVKSVRYRRQRIETPDRDFLDIDLSLGGFPRAAVVCHGLEGSSGAVYIRGLVRALNHSGWDAAALNFRGCSGEPNRRYRSYHSGVTEDLDCAVRHLTDSMAYRELALVGFSLGGNVMLRYLGEGGEGIHPAITRAAAVSVPCDLAASAARMDRGDNRIYMIRFLRTLRRKVILKSRRFPGRINPRDLHGIRTFREFDDLYTAPAHGFKDAADYWRRCSSKPVLHRIAVPTLLISARNDPFLVPACFPYQEAAANRHLYLETPASGGHVGFVSLPLNGSLWHEKRLAAFFSGER